MSVLEPTQALEAERRRRRRLIAQARARGAATGVAAELVLAADQFIITPAGRTEEAARARASGDEVRTVIAGYHWFTDWGRDTMISLEGLTLVTGRHVEAGYILRTFAHYVRDGLIPNMFPEGENEGLYHTADATLWFFHAVAAVRRLLGRSTLTLATAVPDAASGSSSATCAARASASASIRARRAADAGRRGLSAHVDGREGRRLGGHAAPRQGGRDQRALVQRAAADGAVGARSTATAAAEYRERADARAAIVQRALLVPGGRLLYDVVDADGGPANADAKCRPNQVFAVSLPHPVLDARAMGAGHARRARPAADAGRAALARARRSATTRRGTSATSARATPPTTRARCGAWLVGPFVDAWLKVYPTIAARAALDGFVAHLDEAASVRSARCSTPRRRSRRAAASRRRGASPRCCAW